MHHVCTAKLWRALYGFGDCKKSVMIAEMAVQASVDLS
jgi:hypothetical protein